ncbi:MAG: adenylate kinase [Acidimicrobiia bacterium]|nr:adenylate kinase [Acidimicrobiia bacterium]
MIPGARLVLLGRQGAGKGTQCVRLSHHYVIPHISTGDMLRSAVREGTEFGLQAKAVMDRGELVSDGVIGGVVAERLAADDTRERGYILDGFPRTVGQAERLSEITVGAALDLVIDLVVPTQVVLERLAGRRVCVDCATNFSVDSPPRYGWVCDNCGGEVVQRADDTSAAIQIRLDLYERETAPLIAWYLERELLTAVDGLGTAAEVTARLVAAVDARRS